MPDEEKKLTVVIPVEFSREHVIVNENAVYGAPIIPDSPQYLKWRIEIHKNAELKSHVFGRIVNIEDNCRIGGNLFGERNVTMGDRCKVDGNLMSMGEITAGKNTVINGNVIGDKIIIGENSIIEGNVIGNDVKIGKESRISGVVISIKGECALRDDVTARDVISHGRLDIGKNVSIEDNVIWSHEKIKSEKVLLAGMEPNPIHFREYEGSELNLNTDRISVNLKRFEAKKEIIEFLKNSLFTRNME